NLPSKETFETINKFAEDKKHFYVIPDYENEQDARKIIELFGDLPLLSGGSGLLEELGIKNKTNDTTQTLSSSTNGKAIILAGSCSEKTLQQIEYFKSTGGKYFKIDPFKLIDHKQSKETLWE